MQSQRRRAAAIAIAAAAALTLAACSGGDTDGGTDTSSDAGGGDSGDQPYIALVAKGYTHQFWQAVKSGAEEEAAAQGATMTFEAPPTESDIEIQVDLITNAIAKNPDALGIAPLNSQAVAPLVDQAGEAGIPVVIFDTPIEGTDVPAATCKTDNIAASAEAAKQLADAIGHEGTVATVIHDQTSATGQQREQGFYDYMAENEPNITVLDPQYANDQNLAADTAKAIIAANPDLKAIYGSNEGAAIGIVKALEETSNVGNILGVGFDSGKTQTDAVRSGALFGSITQNPVGIGKCTIDALMQVLNGETPDAIIDTGFYFYTADNIDDPEIAAVLYD